MIGVAIVLILLVLVFGFAVVISNTGPARIDDGGFLELSIFGARISSTVPGIFFTGAVTMIILLLALLLLVAGIRRARAQRERIKSLTASAPTTDSVAGGSDAGSTSGAEIEARAKRGDDRADAGTSATGDGTSATGDGPTAVAAPAEHGEGSASKTRPAADVGPASSTSAGPGPTSEQPDGSTGSTPGAGRTPGADGASGSGAAEPETTPEERSRLLEEVERATGDDDRPTNS